MNVSLSPLAPENLVETGSGVSSRVSLLISTLRLSLVLTYGIPPDFRCGVHLFICDQLVNVDQPSSHVECSLFTLYNNYSLDSTNVCSSILSCPSWI